MRIFLGILIICFSFVGYSVYKDSQVVSVAAPLVAEKIVLEDTKTLVSDLEEVATTTTYKATMATFNVTKPENTRYGSWSSRVKKLGTTMVASKANVIGLNEVYYKYQIDGLKKYSGYSIIKPIGTQHYGWSSAIAYKYSNTRVLKSGPYFFKNQYKYTQHDADVGDIKQSTVGKYASRTAVWALMQTGGKKYIFISAHTQVDRNGNINELQIEEIKALGRQLKTKYSVKNVIFAGDLNEDNYSNANCTPQLPTYAGTKATLDYICSTSKVTNAKTINSGESDHYLLYGQTVLY